jgi:hypothetical protein
LCPGRLYCPAKGCGGNVTTLPFEDNEFYMVVSTQVYEYVNDGEKYRNFTVTISQIYVIILTKHLPMLNTNDEIDWT